MKIMLNQKKTFQFFSKNTGLNILIKKLKEKLSSVMDSGMTLTNNELKNLKVIKCLENRVILLKGTAEKAIDQTEGFLSNVLTVLTRVSLSHTISYKCFDAIRINKISIRCSYLKENLWIGHDNLK